MFKFKKKNNDNSKPIDNDLRRFLILTRIIILFIALIWVLFKFVFGFTMAPNNDMMPRIDAGDIVIYSRLNKAFGYNDVVVAKVNNTEYLGRIVGRRKDKINITEDSQLYVNGNIINDEKIYYPTVQYEGFVQYPLTLKKDELFLLSDKRTGGEDSRYYGPVRQKDIKGTVTWVCRTKGF